MREVKKYLQHAFTLIELSIVLAVIGLLIGGIVGGQAIYNGQKLRSIGTEATSYMLAMNQFTQKYAYPPGDLPNATAIWGNATGGAAGANCSNAAVSTTGLGTATCNGDGNGHISRFVMAIPNLGEPWRAWQHMVNAGLIVGKYAGRPYCSGFGPWPNCASGTDGSGFYYTQTAPYNSISADSWPAANVPKGQLPNTAFSWLGTTRSNNPTDLTTWASGGYWVSNPSEILFPGDYTNVMTFGDISISPDGLGPALTPAEALELDRKLDDGRPAIGNIRANGNSGFTPYFCTTGTIATPATSEYDVARADPQCAMMFMPTFAAMKK